MNRALHTGWGVQGGARALFFNKEVDTAWTVDLGASNYNYNGTNNNLTFTLHNLPFQVTDQVGQTTTQLVPDFPVSVDGVNQTFGNVAFGREWWLIGTGKDGGWPLWRVGFDGGGRWGTEKMNLMQLKHRTDVVGGLFFALHSDVEVPCSRAVLFGGVRLEYSYTWSDILQSQNDGDVQALNFMFSFGARF
jgi:hypothetical protein